MMTAGGDKHVIVVGAGMTGLTAAWRLARLGHRVTLVESADRVGGVILTEHREGFTLEQGPFSVLVRSHVFADLIGEVGLEPITASGPSRHGRYVLHEGRLCAVPMSPGALLSTKLLSMGGKLRLLRGVVSSAPANSGDEQSMLAVATRRLGEQAANRMVAAATVGIFAAEAAELSLEACSPRLAAADREARSVIGMMKRMRKKDETKPALRGTISFAGGLCSLAEAMVDRMQAG